MSVANVTVKLVKKQKRDLYDAMTVGHITDNKSSQVKVKLTSC